MCVAEVCLTLLKLYITIHNILCLVFYPCEFKHNIVVANGYDTDGLWNRKPDQSSRNFVSLSSQLSYQSEKWSADNLS